MQKYVEVGCNSTCASCKVQKGPPGAQSVVKICNSKQEFKVSVGATLFFL